MKYKLKDNDITCIRKKLNLPEKQFDGSHPIQMTIPMYKSFSTDEFIKEEVERLNAKGIDVALYDVNDKFVLMRDFYDDDSRHGSGTIEPIEMTVPEICTHKRFVACKPIFEKRKLVKVYKA